MKLGNTEIRNTRDLISPNTRVAMLIWAIGKAGKTTLAASLDKLTRETLGKPTLFIAVEPSDGGGTMSIADLNIDYVQPKSYDEITSLIATLQDDTHYGGVVLDNSSDYVNLHLKPYALTQPMSKAGASEQALRKLGVPSQGDYQVMGEMMRKDTARLMQITVNPNPAKRKHFIMTALQREKTERDTGRIIRIGPDLPGAMMDIATAMFQTVATIDIGYDVVPNPANPKVTMRVQRRTLRTAPRSDVEVLGDRTKGFPDGAPLDLLECWNRFWVPRFAKVEGVAA